MATTSPGEIRIQPEAWELANQINSLAAQLLPRSVAHARLRQTGTVVPSDVRAAMWELLAELQTAFDAAHAGKIEEADFTDEEFQRLTALPFRRPDTTENSDDDL